ncbi:uncharacterized protein LOC135479416 [Liolophura sinensis]|uniref:uncharacterized protein LOC135479416 n=1 Tax=Liolophura sinensis TaxID=3198878 RepID=UPI003158CD08
MGSSSTKIKVSIGNSYNETVWAIVKLEPDRTNCFVPDDNQVGYWYQRQRGFQRIGQGGYVTFDMNIPRYTNQVYVSVGTDSGMQLSDGLPKESVSCNLIVTAEGTVTNARLNARWEDEDGVCHRPGLRTASGLLTSLNTEAINSRRHMRNLNINLVQNLSKQDECNP